MCLCTLCTERFIRSAAATGAFAAYCRERAVPASGVAARWARALRGLPEERRLEAEREVEAACDLGTPAGNAHLLEAAEPRQLPKRAVDAGVPLALWFLTRHPEHFWDVHRHHEHRERDEWYAVRIPAGGLRNLDVPAAAAGLAGVLRSLPPGRVPAGAAWSVTAHAISLGAVCLVAGCGGRGPRPGRAEVQLACYPHDGTLLCKPPPGPPARARTLLDRVGSEVFGAAPAGDAFALDTLKHPFHPPPDAPDMESVRVKALHLRYPEREGRRLLSLDTLTGDAPWSIDELVGQHAGAVLARLTVSHAVLQVRLLDAAGRPRNHLVRLWPDRCDVGRGALGDRLLRCLRLWGL